MAKDIKKRKRVNMSFDLSDYDRLIKKCEAMNIQPSVYCKQMALNSLNDDVKKNQRIDIFKNEKFLDVLDNLNELQNEFKKQGNNLNQIARQLNKYSGITKTLLLKSNEKDINDVIESNQEVIKKIDLLLSFMK